MLKQSPRHWLLSNDLTVAISFVFQFQAYFLAYDSNETENFDGELQFYFLNAKKLVQVLNPFLSFMISFQKAKTHNMLALMLDPCCYPKPSVMEVEIETSLT